MKLVVFEEGNYSKICESTFCGCSSLPRIELPKSVTEFGSYCFSFCTSLSYISMPGVVYYFCSGCFNECPLIETLSMPNTTISFRSEIFKNCIKLKSVQIGCNVTVIQNCQILSDVSISSFIRSIEFIAFDNAL